MEQNHGRNSLLEKELKKGVVKSTAPIGLIITALGLGIVMIIGSYLIKYIRGPLPLNEVYNTEQVKNEYVTLHVQYVLDSFMETYKTRSGIRTKSDTYYLILDEELGAIPVRSSVSRSEELERIMDETWDYLNGVREAPPQGSTITGTMKRMKDEGEKYYQRALDYYELEGSGENYYLWDGLLDAGQRHDDDCFGRCPYVHGTLYFVPAAQERPHREYPVIFRQPSGGNQGLSGS